MVICPKGPKKKVRDNGKFEIAGQILLSETVNAEGTDVLVRDSAIFEIASVRDSGTPLYIYIWDVMRYFVLYV